MSNIKRLFIIFILAFSFQSWVKADDIRDFEIEGMSIGDSLLDHFNNEEIKKALDLNYYQEFPVKYQKIYGYAEFQKLSRFEVYSNVSMDFLINDKKFIFKTITGTFFIDNMKECHAKQNEIDKDLSIIFKDTFRESNDTNHSFDKTGNSKTRSINYWFDNLDLVSIVCTDWSDDIANNFGWSDNLSVEIKSKEYNQFLQEVYK